MSIGLTEHQRRAYEAIIVFVAHHGVLPSAQTLAHELDCSKSNAWQLIAALHERGYITRSGRGGLSLGSGGVNVVIPADVAAKLAAFCKANDESVSAVVADAIALHLDALAGSEQSSVESLS